MGYPRLKLFAMFFLMWIIFLGIGFGIIYALIYYQVLPNTMFSWAFILIIVAMLVILNLVTYFYSDKMVLNAYQARIVDAKQAPRLYNTVKKIAMKADLPVPRVAIIPTPTPNAFATGRDPDHAVVAATEGLLDILDDEELEGVIAHEMAHVKDRDILVMTVAATVAAIIAIVARVILFQMLFGRRDSGIHPAIILVAVITAPIAAILVQLAISRSREYKADHVGAATIQNPMALASALDTLHTMNRRHPMQFRKSSPAHSSLFIVNPFKGGGFVNLFSTHPPMEKRIQRLKEQAEEMGHPQVYKPKSKDSGSAAMDVPDFMQPRSRGRKSRRRNN
ncbi:M48 family metalloprotease [[Eubacterium] cellulosolvens]